MTGPEQDRTENTEENRGQDRTGQNTHTHTPFTYFSLLYHTHFFWKLGSGSHTQTQKSQICLELFGLNILAK